MTPSKKVKCQPDILFQRASIYGTYIKKPKIKSLKNIDLLSELPFYEELSVIKTGKAFRGYAMS